MARRSRPPFDFAGQQIAAGERKTLDLPLSLLSTQTPMAIPVHIVHGKDEGPVLFLSGAIHGDEVNGIEIIRRVLKSPAMARLKGTLIAVPIVNVHGFISHSRYLPDRRDLNRSFPGSAKGSLSARLAHLFLEEVVSKADYGVDLHTATQHRTNWPQIRADLDQSEADRLAQAFGAPVVLNADLRPGSLRAAAQDLGIPVLVYEAGQALAFDEASIRIGVRGIIRLMHQIGMLRGRAARPPAAPVFSASSFWVRADEGGIVRPFVKLGAWVDQGQVLGVVSDPLGQTDLEVRAPEKGLIIGQSNLPAVNEGDALFHLARIRDHKSALSAIERFRDEMDEHTELPKA